VSEEASEWVGISVRFPRILASPNSSPPLCSKNKLMWCVLCVVAMLCVVRGMRDVQCEVSVMCSVVALDALQKCSEHRQCAI
jgi:hypothetical protein